MAVFEKLFLILLKGCINENKEIVDESTEGIEKVSL